MTIIIPNASEVDLLKFMLGVASPSNQIIGLFVNNVTPDDTFVLAGLTEMSTLGYASKSLTMASWTVSAGTAGNPATATYATQTWTFTAGTLVNVYGYFVKDTTNGRLIWVEAFSAAKPVQNTGDQIIVTPTMTLKHQ
jgi:hypothetical protein